MAKFTTPTGDAALRGHRDSRFHTRDIRIGQVRPALAMNA